MSARMARSLVRSNRPGKAFSVAELAGVVSQTVLDIAGAMEAARHQRLDPGLSGRSSKEAMKVSHSGGQATFEPDALGGECPFLAGHGAVLGCPPTFAQKPENDPLGVVKRCWGDAIGGKSFVGQSLKRRPLRSLRPAHDDRSRSPPGQT
jgi:hypothetical protein